MDLTFAYTAGYLDGDGCFYIGKNIKSVKYRSALIVSSSNKHICDFFKTKFGGSCSYKHKNTRFPSHKPISQWQIQGESAEKLTQSLLPYLIEKKMDAQKFINFLHETDRRAKDVLITSVQESRNNENLVTPDIVAKVNEIRCTKPVTHHDCAYLAGFIDSECSLGIQQWKPKNRPNITYKMILACNNTKYPTISWAMQRFGGNCGFVARSATNDLHKDQIQWRLTSKALLSVLPLIIPFLKHKRIVAEKLVEFSETIQMNGGDRQSEKFKHSYDCVLSKRSDLVKQIHLLNSKGI